MARRGSTLKVALSAAEKATLRRRAAAHKTTMAAYVRALALGERPSTSAVPDAWWDELTPARKEQVHGWIGGKHGTPDPFPGQLAMLEEVPD